MKALLIALFVALSLGAQAAPQTAVVAGARAPILHQSDGAQGDTCG